MVKIRSYKGNIIKALIAVILSIAVFIIAFFLSGIDLDSENLFGGLYGFDKQSDFVRIIDVGQGDSILIYSNGYSALIDTGMNTASAEVCAALESCGIKKLDVLLLTHLDNDHVGGVGDVTEFYGAENLILPEISVESEGLSAAQLAISNIAESGGNIYTAVQG